MVLKIEKMLSSLVCIIPNKVNQNEHRNTLQETASTVLSCCIQYGLLTLFMLILSFTPKSSTDFFVKNFLIEQPVAHTQ